MGTRPSVEDHERFKRSPRFNQKELIFENRIYNIYKIATARFGWREYIQAIRIGRNSIPKSKFQEEKPDLKSFLSPSQNIKVIWLGHSSLLMNFEGEIILVDPVLLQTASPFRFLGRRFQPSALSIDELPNINYVVISHDHYDHLDMGLVKHLKDKDTKFIVPLGVGSHLRGWEVSAEKITELDWWESAKIGGLEFIATPSQHSSGRNPFKPNETLWASWVIQGHGQSLFFGGDSGYDIHFKEIGARHGPFNVAFIENGQYDDMWPEMHLLPDESIKAFQDLNAKAFFPIHWGMFNIAYHPWYEPVLKSHNTAMERGIRFIAPLLGEIAEIDDGKVHDNWWKQYIPSAF